MIIALDYDGTYTADSGLWDDFIRAARKNLHQVHIVTMRHESEPVRLGAKVDRIHYTDRKAKRAYMELRGIQVQIWIDDRPEFILMPATPRAIEHALAQVKNGGPLDWTGA